MTDLVHTLDETLERFELIEGAGSETGNKACVMTAIAWQTGAAFTDSPPCAHPILRALAINANDADGTTPDQRADILRAGQTGLIDTWWVPTVAVLAALARPDGTGDETPVQRCLRTLNAVTEWKDHKQKPYLSDADLGGAYLGGANLGGANLRDAYLRDAYLSDADLRDADLRDADLGGAYLRDADLRDADLRDADLGGAYLRDADLRDADLGGAYLRDADLGGAYLRGADLGDADLRGAVGVVLPDGWVIDEGTGIVSRKSEVAS